MTDFGRVVNDVFYPNMRKEGLRSGEEENRMYQSKRGESRARSKIYSEDKTYQREENFHGEEKVFQREERDYQEERDYRSDRREYVRESKSEREWNDRKRSKSRARESDWRAEDSGSRRWISLDDNEEQWNGREGRSRRRDGEDCRDMINNRKFEERERYWEAEVKKLKDRNEDVMELLYEERDENEKLRDKIESLREELAVSQVEKMRALEQAKD